MNELLQTAKSAPRSVQALVATAIALIALASWGVPQILDLVDLARHGRLERVNLLAADELFGSKAVEACSLSSIDATVQAFDIGVLVKVRTDNGSRQRQFFPRQGIDAFLASRSTTLHFDGFGSAVAYAQEPKGTPPVCEEVLLERLSQHEALVACTFASGCIERYVLDLRTGEVIEYRSERCPG